MNYQRLFGLIGILGFAGCINSCTPEGEECQKCDDAIVHMHEKLPDNACNPNWMENATNRIEDECGVINSQYIIGYMAHNCVYSTNALRPFCEIEDNGVNFPKKEIYNANFEIVLVSLNSEDDSIKVRIEDEFRAPEVIDEFYLKSIGQQKTIEMNTGISDGENINVSVIDPETEDVIHFDQESLYFYRPDFWHQPWRIEIYYSEAQKGYDVTFTYF